MGVGWPEGRARSARSARSLDEVLCRSVGVWGCQYNSTRVQYRLFYVSTIIFKIKQAEQLNCILLLFNVLIAR